MSDIEPVSISVSITEPILEVKQNEILFVVNITVTTENDQQDFRHISYESPEAAVKRAELHMDNILKAAADLDTWLAAHD